MWVTLSQRKTSVLAHHNDVSMQEIANSRTVRRTHRNSTYEQTLIKRNRAADLETIKEPYDTIKGDRPDVDSEEYNEWYQNYQDAREEYEYQKNQIMEEYDDMLAMLEEETNDKETELEEERAQLEAQMEALAAELEKINEQISADIERTAVNLS